MKEALKKLREHRDQLQRLSDKWANSQSPIDPINSARRIAASAFSDSANLASKLIAELESARVDTVTAGEGWEFCSSDQADQWYDFHMNQWKEMHMAGYFFRGIELHRRRVSENLRVYEVADDEWVVASSPADALEFYLDLTGGHPDDAFDEDSVKALTEKQMDRFEFTDHCNPERGTTTFRQEIERRKAAGEWKRGYFASGNI